MNTLWRFDINTGGKLADCERLLELPYSINFNVGEATATCFVEGTRDDAVIACRMVNQIGYQTGELIEVQNENWVAKCSAMWEPVKALDLSIIPVIDTKAHAESPKNTLHAKDNIFIVPGSGFGTGHHPSTFAALCLMQDALVVASKPKLVLDVGAGSGILSIAAAKLYDSKVFAYDVDQQALDNAESCMELNPASMGKIELICSALPVGAPVGDLILANIYGEILIETAPLFKAKVKSGGHIILAGITSEIVANVRQRFEHLGFRKCEHLKTAEWNAFLFVNCP